MHTIIYYALLGATGALIGIMLGTQGWGVWTFWPFYVTLISVGLLFFFDFLELRKELS